MSTRFERRTMAAYERRQLSGIGSVISSVVGNGNGNNGNGNGNGGNTAEPTTSERTRGLTTTETTATTAPTTTATTQTTPSPTTAPVLTTARPITTVPGTTITTVLTPSTLIVIGTSTITSALRPTTLVSSLPPSTASALPTDAANSSSSSGLTSGARTGIIVGSVLGALALLALLVVLCLGCKRRRKNDLDRADNIRWPEVAASPDDRAALYPESTHPTGRAGLGGEMEEHDGPSLVQTGAGAAGLGAFRGQSGSDYSRRQPTLPSIPAGVYNDEYNSHSYASTPYNSTEGNPYGGAASSTQSHQPLAPGPASIEYHNNNSPPSHNFLPTRSGSSHGHSQDAGAAGALPMPGSSDEDHSERSGTGSPTQGYNPTTRLSIVNPSDPDGRY